MVTQVAAMAYAFNKADKIYPDIKAENFLQRESGEVITADLKTVKRTNNGVVKVNLLDATPDYEPPECKNPKSLINAEKYMSYQIGLMTYLLLTGLKGDEKYAAMDKFHKGKGLDFDSYPIFQGKEGAVARQIIESCVSSDPNKRPSLDSLQSITDKLSVKPTHGAEPEIEKDKEMRVGSRH